MAHFTDILYILCTFYMNVGLTQGTLPCAGTCTIYFRVYAPSFVSVRASIHKERAQEREHLRSYRPMLRARYDHRLSLPVLLPVRLPFSIIVLPFNKDLSRSSSIAKPRTCPVSQVITEAKVIK